MKTETVERIARFKESLKKQETQEKQETLREEEYGYNSSKEDFQWEKRSIRLLHRIQKSITKILSIEITPENEHQLKRSIMDAKKYDELENMWTFLEAEILGNY